MENLAIEHDKGISYFCALALIFFSKESKTIYAFNALGMPDIFELSEIKSLRTQSMLMKRVITDALTDWGYVFTETELDYAVRIDNICEFLVPWRHGLKKE